MPKSHGQRLDRARLRGKMAAHAQWDMAPLKKEGGKLVGLTFIPRRIGKPDLDSYIKQQRAARSHRMKITLAKRWEG